MVHFLPVLNRDIFFEMKSPNTGSLIESGIGIGKVDGNND